jgi:tight adherence protein B
VNDFLGSQSSLLVGVIACSLAVLIGVYLVATPAPFRLAAARRRPTSTPKGSAVSVAAERAAALIDRILRRRRDTEVHVAVLERAGVTMRLQDFALLMVISGVVLVVGGLLLEEALIGLLLALTVPLTSRAVLEVMAGRRKRVFADQLDDSLQLMSSSLRAGHSLMQSLAAVARDAEEPTAGEFARIINEARVGRELTNALKETAARMDSEDFVWVTQAIAINREAGGNLAEVLDRVGQTIRERNQIRRQVVSLSAEGKLSAYVLIALPIGVTGFLSVTNPAYLAKFTHSLTGYGLMFAAVVLLVVGALWMRKVVSFKF